MAREYRKNSLVIDFGSLPARPSIGEVRSFIFECLKLEMTQIRNLQASMSKARVFLEMETNEQAENVVLEHNLKFSIHSNGQDYAIPLYMADGAIDVKVFDLPPYLPNKTIAKHLAVYGEILSIKDDVWVDFFPGVPNGNRTVRMKLKKSIPSYLTIEDEVAYIKYRNQTPTCRHCSRNLHIGTKCSDVRKALGSVNSRLTLAKVVKGMNPDIRNDYESDTGNPGSSSRRNIDVLLDDGESNLTISDDNDDEINDTSENTNYTNTKTKQVNTPINPNEQKINEQTNEKEPATKRPASPKLDDQNNPHKNRRPSRSSSRNK